MENKLEEFKEEFYSDLDRGFEYAEWFEREIKWLIQQSEKVEKHKEIVRNVLDNMSGYDAHKYGDQLEKILNE